MNTTIKKIYSERKVKKLMNRIWKAMQQEPEDFNSIEAWYALQRVSVIVMDEFRKSR
jgi:hypothetical protein